MKKLLLLLFLITPFVPYFGAIDKIGSQWLFLATLNLISFLAFLKNKEYSNLFFKLFNLNFVKFYVLFISIAFLSIFYSNNPTLSFVDFSRIITTFFLSFNIIYIFFQQKIKFEHLLFSILVIDFFVICYSYKPLIDFVLNNSFYSIDFSSVPNALRGPTGNKNVLASYLVFNSSFALFMISNKNLLYKFFSFVILFLTTITIILLASRASIISLSLLFFFYILYYSFTFKKHNFSPLFLIIATLAFSYAVYLNFLPSNFNVISKVQSINQTDTSTNFRIILWENALDFISENPLVGCGIGNWKIESLPYWKDRLTGYTIPYHAHNDFLELSAETGILGGLSYLFIFISIAYLVFINFKKNTLLSLLIFCLLFVYCFDASVNFPLERAISQLNFALLLFFSIYISLKNENKAI